MRDRCSFYSSALASLGVMVFLSVMLLPGYRADRRRMAGSKKKNDLFLTFKQLDRMQKIARKKKVLRVKLTFRVLEAPEAVNTRSPADCAAHHGVNRQRDRGDLLPYEIHRPCVPLVPT